MTLASNDILVTVTATAGLVKIESGSSSSPIFRSTLEFPGGTATFDVEHPNHPPSTTIDDAEAAESWLAQLYGPPVLAYLSGIDADAPSADPAAEQVPYEPTDTSATLWRLALGQWLWRYWPVAANIGALDIPLLRFELAALAWSADDYFLGLQPAAGFLTGYLEKLRDAAGALAEEPAWVQETDLGRVILGALDAAVVGPSGTIATPDDALLDELDGLLTRLVAVADDQEVSPGAAPEIRSLEQWLKEQSRQRAELVGQLREHFTLAAGDTGTAARSGVEGVQTVDWLQVPPRVLDWSENGVRWSAEPAGDEPGTWRVSIRVDAVPLEKDADSPRLFARGYLPDGSPAGDLPILVVPLAKDDDAYAGSGLVSAEGLDHLRIDIYSAASVIRPIIGDGVRKSWMGQRDKARQFIRKRSRGLGFTLEGPDRPFVAETNR